MTTAALPHPLSETPPKDAGETGAYVVVAHHYPMRTQPRSIRVTYMVEPAAFACAVLPEAAAILAHSGAGLAVKADAVRETAAAALAHCSPSEK